jgi:hypothetical protein
MFLQNVRGNFRYHMALKPGSYTWITVKNLKFYEYMYSFYKLSICCLGT